MTIFSALEAINAYPIPPSTIMSIAEEQGLNAQDELTLEVRTSKSFRIALANLFLWLAYAPNVSQAGIAYSFTDEQRLSFRNKYTSIYNDCGEPLPAISYGYRGNRL